MFSDKNVLYIISALSAIEKINIYANNFTNPTLIDWSQEIRHQNKNGLTPSKTICGNILWLTLNCASY